MTSPKDGLQRDNTLGSLSLATDLSATLSQSTRKYWVDFLRALTIVLVVFGHVDDHQLTHYLSAVRLPMFFFISGLLASRVMLAGSFQNYLRKYFWSLIVPFYVFGLAVYPFWYFKNLHVPTTTFLRDGSHIPFFGMLYGVNGPQQWLIHNYPLWFLTCLFSVHHLFWVIRRLFVTPFQILLASLFLGLCGFLILHLCPFRLPWNLEIAMAAIVFYAMGYLSKTLHLTNFLARDSNALLAFPVALAVCIGIVLVNGPIDMDNGVLGRPEFYYLGGLGGIVACIIIAMRMPYSRVVSFIAKNTLAILAMHSPLLFLLRKTANHFWGLGIQGVSHILTYTVSATVISITMALLVSIPLRAYAPWTLGLRSPSPTNRLDAIRTPSITQ